MSQINVTTIRNRTGGPPSLDQGVVVGSAATFSSTVSIAGVLTYEDVTNIDSVGIITARTGLKVTAGGIDVTAGGINVTAGIVTATTFSGNLPTTDLTGTITNAQLTAGSVDIAHLAAGTDGKIITWDANGAAAVVGPGADGQVLTSTGAGSPPAFEDAAGGVTLTGSTNNTIPTITGADALQGEANLTFDGSTLDVTGAGTFSSDLRVDHSNNAGSDKLLRLGNVNNSGTNSAHLWTPDAYYVGPTDVDGTGYKVKIAAGTGAAEFSGAISAGGGIYLSDTGSTTAAANHLGDYEEGTWTPALSGDWSNITYTTQRGRYIKIGNLVYLYYTLQMSAATSPGGAYAFAVFGVPFTGYDYLAGYFGGGVSSANIDIFLTDEWKTVWYGGANTSFSFNDQGGNTSLRCGANITSTANGQISGYLIYSADTF